MRFFDKAGVIHVHTRYSDGAGSVRAVARAAVRAGVDFVVVTDHDTLAGLRRGEDGWYDRLGRPTGAPGAARTLVVIGQEISPEDGLPTRTCGRWPDEAVSGSSPIPSILRQSATR